MTAALTLNQCGGTIAIGAENSGLCESGCRAVSFAVLQSRGFAVGVRGNKGLRLTNNSAVDHASRLDRLFSTPATRESQIPHFIDNHINFRRLFAEAIQDSVRDYYQNPVRRAVIEPGFYLMRRGRNRPLVAAKIWWCDHEPGAPDNKLDRWPIPFLAGDILGEWCDPAEIWVARDRQPLLPRPGLTIEAEYAFRCADADWSKQHAPHEPGANPRRPAELTLLPPIGPPK